MNRHAHPSSARPASATIAALAIIAVGSLLPGQQSTWSRLANPLPPICAAFDSTRNCTVMSCGDDRLRHQEWDGLRVRERLDVFDTTSQPVYLFDDPRNARLIGVAILSFSAPYVLTWDGGRWREYAPAGPVLDHGARFAFDEHRGRLVAAQPVGVPGVIDVYEWDGSTWWPMAAIGGPAWRTEFAFAYDAGARRCVLYGGNAFTTTFADCWSWDGTGWSQIAAAAPPGPRIEPGLAYLPGTGLVLRGGSGSTDTWRLNGSTWAQVTTAHDPGAHASARLVRDPFGLLLYGDLGVTGMLWRFDGVDWQATGTTAVWPRLGLLTGYAEDRARGQVVVHPGLDAVDTIWTFDTQWHGTAAPGPAARNSAGLCWSSVEQQVLLFGGVDLGNTSFGDTWSWNGSAWVSRSPSVSPSPRRRHLMVEDPAGGVLLFGGQDGGPPFGDQWRWDGTTWQQVTPPQLPPAMAGAHAAFDPLRQLVVTVTPLVITPTGLQTWEWDGSSWTHAATSPISQPVGGVAMAFDPRMGKVIALPGATYAWNGAVWNQVPTVLSTSMSGMRGIVTDTVRQRVLAIGATVATLNPQPPAVGRLGTGCALGPSPVLSAIADPTVANAGFALDLATYAAGAPSFVVLGFGAVTTPLGAGCAAHVATPVAAIAAIAPASGQVRVAFPIPADPGLLGVEIAAQGAVLEPTRSPIGSVTLSGGLAITIGE